MFPQILRNIPVFWLSNLIVTRLPVIVLILGFFLFRNGAAAVGADGVRGFAEPTRDGIDFFESKIRPVLTERCYECHSSTAKKVKGGLLLDSREGVTKGGESGPVIVPGEPEKSRLIHAIRYTDQELQMPPKKMLSPQQIADFESWVRLGAPDPRKETVAKSPGPSSTKIESSTRYWAFQEPGNPTIPKVQDKKWPRDPIDIFVLAELEKWRISPAAPAGKRTLIRRATFDLIGLPPRPEEIDAFLADHSAEAFPRVVDRLLDSPHFGERWGRHWLDVARYADSNGLEVNLPYENAWRYRDYVVKSFNQDKPFDQFIREQLAGDLLPATTDEQRYELLTATGFLMLGPKLLFEPRKNKLVMDISDEQIDVTTRAFLGLTVSCARCHDHKFDPIPTRDYYALAGIFTSTATLAANSPENRGGTRWMERPLAPLEKAKAIEEHTARVARIESELSTAREMAMAFPGGVNSRKLSGIVLDNTAAELTGRWKESTYATQFVDKDYLQDGNAGKGTKSARFVPNLPKAGQYEVLIAYVPRENRATNVPVTIHSAKDAQTMAVDQTRSPTIDGVFVSLGTFEFSAGTNGSVVVSNEGTAGFVTVDAVRFVPVETTAMAMKMTASRSTNSATLKPELAGPSYEKLEEELEQLRAKAPPPVPVAMAVQDGVIGNSRINVRGDPEKLGEEVPRGFLTALAGPRSGTLPVSTNSSGRLELARWIASAENPLTARVAVNRIWQHLIGRGLVETVDNFGALGEKPTHAELLDYLAKKFVEQEWSIKRMIRTIMLSNTYQMSSDYNSAAYELDPENKLLWRMNRRRLEVEPIRDAILAVSGQLDRTAGGSLAPTNSAPMGPASSNNAQLNSRRRSLYLPVIRNDTPDMFQVFDFADPHVITGKRHTTSAATQALFMMNSPFIQEQSARWAESLIGLTVSTDAERVALAFARALGRPASPQGVERALQFIERFQNGLQQTETDAGKRRLAAWQSFCQALFASTEFRFVD